MNQILYVKLKRKIIYYKIIFYVFVLFFLALIIYFIYNQYRLQKVKKLCSNLINTFSIDKLYYNLSTDLSKTINYSSDIIGVIEIEKINIKYPIFSNIDDELLKIAPCRFYGPLPNNIGNLCIAGHNYNNDLFFSNLNLLEIGDLIKILDINNNFCEYHVYDIFEIDKNNTDCVSQDTNGLKEITLITCNNINKKRLIIKALETSKEHF